MGIDMIWLWVLFNIAVLVMLAIDLGVFHKDDKPISVKEALIWSGIWIVVAGVFNLGVWYFWGSQKALEFLTGYVIERSLSIDNIFVFILVFTYFAVLPRYQYKVLFWGIIGALVMRASLILLGTASYDPSLADADAARAAVAARPGWADLSAVAEGRVVPYSDDIVTTRPGPRIVEGLEALARAIHPDRFD